MNIIKPILFLAVGILLINSQAIAQVSGQARVVDGDTVEIGAAKIRLHGIDAPESSQLCSAEGKTWPCGRMATAALKERIGGRVVTCSERDLDRYGRIVGVCSVNNTDLNAWLVSEGWAVAYRKYSHDYVEEESFAKGARNGIWQGEFEYPWDWRAGNRRQSNGSQGQEASNESSGECRIKGNISSSGRIYHVPGGRHYGRTKINTSKGERWFCTEEEAREAGWRKSRQ